MNVVDPRSLSDRQLLTYLAFGDLPRPGWPGRGRAIARRMLEVAAITVAIVIVGIVVWLAIVLAWAAQP